MRQTLVLVPQSRNLIAMRKILKMGTPILLLLLGLMILIATSSLVRDPALTTILTLVALVAFNWISARLLGVIPQLKQAWSLQKIWQLFPGFLIGLIPISTAYAFFYFNGELPTFKGISWSMAALTLVTVSWEEAWFRGIALELAGMRYSQLLAAFIFGALFAALHILNPKIDLLQDGLQLLVAGYALSLCYFAFGSIWAAIGMHFANNLTQALFGMSTEPRTIYFNLPLAIIAVGFTIVVARKSAGPSRLDYSAPSVTNA